METIRTSVAVLTLIEESIILFHINEYSELGMKEMLEVREANNILSKGNSYCVLMDAGDFSSSSKEAREESASEEHSKNRIAMGIIQNNFAIKIMTRFYLKINKPVRPTKIFKTKEEALVWLRQMRDDYYSGKGKR